MNGDPLYGERALVKELLARLGAVQQVFIQLLSDPKSKHLSRESACLGLAACRGVVGAVESLDGQSQSASAELNDRLLRAFGHTTNYGGSALMETSAQASERRAAEQGTDAAGAGPELLEVFGFESEVGGASGLSEAALGAYREMAAASVSLGRHDILYALLILSVSHPCWLSEGTRDRYRYVGDWILCLFLPLSNTCLISPSAPSLLGDSSFLGSRANTLEMQSALRPHLGKLLPRILRARHDPNRQTRDQMTSLWDGLTGGGADARLAVTQHFLPTIDSLIDDASSKFWRARVGACGALAEIIVGRDWTSLGGGGPVLDDEYSGSKAESAGVRLLRLWKVTMRSLDDVRGAVRDSGETLARAVRALAIRLCDPTTLDKGSGMKRGREDIAKDERDASSAAATSLRWLIRYGLSQPCPEATGICISTLVEVVGVAKATILKPILPDLLRSLLMAMSGLEPAALNYLQLRTSDQDGLERARLQLAQSGPLATAVAKCLDMFPRLDLATQQAVVPQLDSALRMAAGFATRAAVADSVSTLCSTCPNSFRFPGSSTSNPSVRLLRAFYFASERERGQAAKDKMVHALGNLAAVCPAAAVRSLALRACERYSVSTGNLDDPVSRKAAASAIRAIAVRASGHMSDEKSAEAWRKRILPVAFIGRKDADTKIASIWNEVWDEGSGVDGSGEGESFGTRLEETILPFLVNECMRALDDVSWSRRVAGATALGDLSSLGVLAPVQRSAGASTEAQTARARYRSEYASKSLHQCLNVLIKPKLWTGKADVLKATVDIATKWATAEASRDKDEQVLYGWRKSAGCPWKPLFVSSESSHDLFVGDSFFLSHNDIETENEEDKAVDDTPSEGENDNKIDFEKCDADLAEGDEELRVDSEMPSNAPVCFLGICRLFIDKAAHASQSVSDESLPYRVSAFQGFRSLMQSIPRERVDVRERVFQMVAADVTKIVQGSDSSDKQAPVLVAGALNALASSFWIGIGSSDSDVDVAALATTLKDVGGDQQPAWTVREASCLSVADLASACSVECLRQHVVVATIIEGAKQGLKDRKFWKVRYVLSVTAAICKCPAHVRPQIRRSKGPATAFLSHAVNP